LKQLEDCQSACSPLLNVLSDETLMDELRSGNAFTREVLKSRCEITDAHIEDLYRFAKVKFDCGAYQDAADMLHYYRMLTKDDEKSFAALWGQLASHILVVQLDAAWKDLNTLRDLIESRTHVSQPEQLRQRTWLIHWSLFIFYNLPEGRSLMNDFLLSNDRLVNAIQTNCPHILRYLTIAVVCDKRRKNFVNDFVRVLKEEAHVYEDPVTKFLLSAYVDFDFDAAQLHLKESIEVLGKDFFAVLTKDEFVREARILMFETIARIHKYIDLRTLRSWLDFGSDSAESEVAIVNLIRDSQVDAKLDSSNNRLVLVPNVPSIYQQIIDKTKQVNVRTSQLSAQLEKKYQSLLDVEEE